jgi:hypothetical protein
MDRAQIEPRNFLGRRLQGHLPVEGVARLQDDAVAGPGVDDRLDPLMPPVVPNFRLRDKGPALVDVDAVRCSSHESPP